MFTKDYIYTVHENETITQPEDRIVLVREGFSFAAFLLTVLWALAHRLWLFAAIYLSLMVSIFELGELAGLNDRASMVLQLGLQIWFGCAANDARRAALAARGYEEVGVVCADSHMQAQLRYYQQHQAA